MRRNCHAIFCKAKSNKCQVVEAASVESESARQFLKRLVVLEFGDVLDRCDGDARPTVSSFKCASKNPKWWREPFAVLRNSRSYFFALKIATFTD